MLQNILRTRLWWHKSRYNYDTMKVFCVELISLKLINHHIIMISDHFAVYHKHPDCMFTHRLHSVWPVLDTQYVVHGLWVSSYSCCCCCCRAVPSGACSDPSSCFCVSVCNCLFAGQIDPKTLSEGHKCVKVLYHVHSMMNLFFPPSQILHRRQAERFPLKTAILV